ncbi:NADH-quinone oxidoreductase subunit M [bacterium]|nr:MAG: NADH-quinone oxidoreductase subunit M [bacterium]
MIFFFKQKYYSFISFLKKIDQVIRKTIGVESSFYKKYRFIIQYYHFEFIGYLFFGLLPFFVFNFFHPFTVEHYEKFLNLFGYLPYGIVCAVGLVPMTIHFYNNGVKWWKIILALVVAIFILGVCVCIFDHDWNGKPSFLHFYNELFVVDTFNYPFLFLTFTIFPLVVLASVDTQRGSSFFYYSMLALLFFLLLLTFTLAGFFSFYIVFELLGFPMFILIGLYGPREQRIAAAYKFFVYTFIGSAFILPVLVYFYFYLGSTHFLYLQGYRFTDYEQSLFFVLCSFPFLVKIPVVPVHLWLPEAHVEASTPISMLLAALLLKTGGYAFLRFLLPVFPFGVYFWSSLLSVLGLCSIFFSSVYALIQVDLKKMIAYSSVAHMSLVFLGLINQELTSLQGAVYLMVTHGFTSAGLFAGIGIIYDRYHTRTIRALGGIASLMPIFSLLFFYFILGNISFPFTGGFTGEFYLLLGLTKVSLYLSLMAGSTVFLSICYSVWLFNRVFYGQIEEEVKVHQDLTGLEFALCYFLGLGVLATFFKGGDFACYTQYSYGSIIDVVSGEQYQINYDRWLYHKYL